MRAELFHREPLTMHADCPLKDIVCVLLAQTKDATIVCVIGCQITRTRIHTLLERLASARHDNKGKLYSNQNARFKQTSQWRRRRGWFSWRPFYCGRAGSDVMGCRRPSGCVFTSGGPLSALTCCVNARLLSAIKKISPLIYSQSWVGSWVYTTQAMMTFTLIF